MKEIAVDILLCIVDRQRTLMKGDKVVELLKETSNSLLFSHRWRHHQFHYSHLLSRNLDES